MTSSWFQECIYWMKSVISRHLLELFIFSIIVLLFHGCIWSDPYVKGTVSISEQLWQPFIILQTVCGWFEKNWKICLFEESYCSPALLKVPIYIHRTSYSNICLKRAVLNARKYLQPPQPPNCLLVNLLICHFTTVMAAIH